MTSIMRSCDTTINGRVAKCGFRVPYRPWDKETRRIKNVAVAKLTRTAKRPLVRIRKRGSVKYWLIKPVKEERLFRNPMLLKSEGIRLKRSKAISAFRIRKIASRKPWFALYTTPFFQKKVVGSQRKGFRSRKNTVKKR